MAVPKKFHVIDSARGGRIVNRCATWEEARSCAYAHNTPTDPKRYRVHTPTTVARKLKPTVRIVGPNKNGRFTVTIYNGHTCDRCQTPVPNKFETATLREAASVAAIELVPSDEARAHVSTGWTLPNIRRK